MHTFTIVSTSKDRVQSTGEEFLSVKVEVKRDDESIGFRQYGFPLTATADEIRTELERNCAGFDADAAAAERNAASDAANANADEVSAALIGTTLEPNP